MDFMFIRDTVTGSAIDIIQEDPQKFIVVEYDARGRAIEPIVIGKRSIGKVIRTWMRLRMKDIG